MSSWFVRDSELKDRLVANNLQINWIPGHVREGLFGNWLENARDWSISRNRFWGSPMPVWRSDDPKYPRVDVYGSVAELERDFGVPVIDLHRPAIDRLVRPNPDDPSGESMMRRIPDVLDCWFESKEYWDYVLRQNKSIHVWLDGQSEWRDFGSFVSKSGESVWLGLVHFSPPQPVRLLIIPSERVELSAAIKPDH